MENVKYDIQNLPTFFTVQLLGIHLAQENFYASTGYLVKVGSE